MRFDEIVVISIRRMIIFQPNENVFSWKLLTLYITGYTRKFDRYINALVQR